MGQVTNTLIPPVIGSQLRVPGTRVARLGLPDRFLDHADQDAQWKEAGIDAEAIARAAVDALRACEPAVVRRPEAAA